MKTIYQGIYRNVPGAEFEVMTGGGDASASPGAGRSYPKSGTLRRALGALLAAGVIAGAMAPAESLACDSCNLAFKDEVLNDRAGTPAGMDLAAAMENQRGLPLNGLSSAPFGDEEEPPAGNAGAGRIELASATGATTPAATASSAAPLAAASALAPLSTEFGELYEGEDFIEIIRRDEGLSFPTTGYVPQDIEPDKSFTIELDEGMTYLGNNVMYDGFLTNGTVPGPTIVVEQGDIVEFNVVNRGNVPHGASIHAAYTQTSNHLGQIMPGQTKTVLFRATYPGVFMYHCAPGGHAIPMHVLFGQYGMMVVKPTETQYKLEEELGQEPDVELYLVQHEWYASGKDAIEGNPMYVTFNGKLFRYIEEPIQAKPGDYVRVYFLNIGPNLLSTFHLVGIIWDYVYWQGHPEAVLPGGQTVTAGPSDSWVIEFRVPPEEGPYTMLSHAVGSTSRGAIGLLVGDRNAETPVTIMADGPAYSPEELEEMAANATRIISPFQIGTAPVDDPVVYGPETDEVTVEIIGNSYYPKVIEVAPGTTVTWVNEDVFSFLAGEFSGIHNVVTMGEPPERFASNLLAHGEKFSFTFQEEGVYDYFCTPHPYMEARVIVTEAPVEEDEVAASPRGGTGPWALALAGLATLLALASLMRNKLR